MECTYMCIGQYIHVIQVGDAVLLSTVVEVLFLAQDHHLAKYPRHLIIFYYDDDDDEGTTY